MMSVKRIMSKGAKKYRSCIKCDTPIARTLRDNMEYTCPVCGQVHLVDIYPEKLVLTAAEHPEIRRRSEKYTRFRVHLARKYLIDKLKK